MTLAEKITALRTKRKWSQGDLAEKLGVSRQSVSKWETGASTPELEKLIQLADLFGITLDELARAGEAPEKPEPEHGAPSTPERPVPEAPPRQLTTQKIVGYILLGVGLLAFLLANWLGLYLLLCAAICLITKRDAGLIIGWETLILFLLLAPNYTGVRVFKIFRPEFWAGELGTGRIELLLWGLFLALVWLTVRTWKKRKNA